MVVSSSSENCFVTTVKTKQDTVVPREAQDRKKRTTFLTPIVKYKQYKNPYLLGPLR